MMRATARLLLSVLEMLLRRLHAVPLPLHAVLQLPQRAVPLTNSVCRGQTSSGSIVKWRVAAWIWISRLLIHLPHHRLQPLALALGQLSCHLMRSGRLAQKGTRDGIWSGSKGPMPKQMPLLASSRLL